MPRSLLAVLAAAWVAVHPAVTCAGLLSLTVIGGLTSLDGSTEISDPVPQETLTSSTLAQLASPLLYDPEGFLGLTVRIQNVSDREIAFPDALPGVSVLTGVIALPGYSTKLNVAAGGAAGKSGAPGEEGAVSRTAIDMSGGLDAIPSVAVGSDGGGGGAATGVADNWIAVTGASGYQLAAYLAGLTLKPGEWVDIPDFARISSFGRAAEEARIALGIDLPTFSFGGITVTSVAWTGEFAGPRPAPAADPGSVPEPPGVVSLLVGLAGLVASGRRARAIEQRRE